jgi:hypothetical protein
LESIGAAKQREDTMTWILYIAGVAKLAFSGEHAAAACKNAYLAVQYVFGEHAAACALQVAI